MKHLSTIVLRSIVPTLKKRVLLSTTCEEGSRSLELRWNQTNEALINHRTSDSSGTVEGYALHSQLNVKKENGW